MVKIERFINWRLWIEDMNEGKKGRDVEYLDDPTNREVFIQREHAFRQLSEGGLVQRLGLNPRELQLYRVSKFGLRAVQRLLQESKEKFLVFFPYGVEGTGGLAVGLQQYLGSDAGSMTQKDFYERLKTVEDGERTIVALSKPLELSVIRDEVRKSGITDVEGAVEQVNGAAHGYLSELSGLLTRYRVKTIEELEKIPRALLEPSKLGIDNMEDPLERILKILDEDHIAVLFTARSISGAAKRLQSSIEPSKEYLNHAMATMLYTMIDLETLRKANPEDKRFHFTIDDMLKIAFAVYNHDIGLWLRSSKVDAKTAVTNHPLWGATLYKTLIGKDPDFRLFGDEQYQGLIAGHHAGINGVSQYPYNGTEVMIFNPAQVPVLSLDDKLSVPRQLSFTYEFLLSRAGGWLRDEGYFEGLDKKAKGAGWRSGKEFLSFLAMNYLKEEGMGDGRLIQPGVLRRVISTTGIHPRGSEVEMRQKSSLNPRHTKFDYDGCRGKVLPGGMILPIYDAEGKDIYDAGPVDLRMTMGEAVQLQLFKIDSERI